MILFVNNITIALFKGASRVLKVMKKPKEKPHQKAVKRAPDLSSAAMKQRSQPSAKQSIWMIKKDVFFHGQRLKLDLLWLKVQLGTSSQMYTVPAVALFQQTHTHSGHLYKLRRTCPNNRHSVGFISGKCQWACVVYRIHVSGRRVSLFGYFKQILRDFSLESSHLHLRYLLSHSVYFCWLISWLFLIDIWRIVSK